MVEVPGAAEWRLDLVGVVEEAVVDLVASAVFAEGDERLEAVSPQDLRGQIGGSRLRGLSGALDAALEDHDNLETLAHDIRSAQRVKRAAYVNFVHHRHWPDEENVVLVAVGAHHQLVLVHCQQLALLGLPRADQLRADAGADDVRLSHVSDAEHEAQLAIPLADDGAAAEQQRLRPLLGPRHLGEHDAHHERLNHHASDALQAHDEDRLGTLLRRRSANNEMGDLFKNWLFHTVQ